MSYLETDSPEKLKEYTADDLKSAAQNEGIAVTAKFLDKILEGLLSGLSSEYDGQGAVVLIDEYDAPVARHIGTPELAVANAQVLHGFYTGLKTSIKHIRFAFVTGVTRFALTALDSGPNHFYDLSLVPEYAGICGFAVSEFDTSFQDRMAETLKALVNTGQMESSSQASDLLAVILDWYDGYNWLGPEQVLNPYSILRFFEKVL